MYDSIFKVHMFPDKITNVSKVNLQYFMVANNDISKTICPRKWEGTKCKLKHNNCGCALNINDSH